MELDENVCLCFHVTRRKLANYLRVEKPSRPSQLSQCGGAGTGCGWCVPILESMYQQSVSDPSGEKATELPSAEGYAQKRQRYIENGKTR